MKKVSTKIFYYSSKGFYRSYMRAQFIAVVFLFAKQISSCLNQSHFTSNGAKVQFESNSNDKNKKETLQRYFTPQLMVRTLNYV